MADQAGDKILETLQREIEKIVQEAPVLPDRIAYKRQAELILGHEVADAWFDRKTGTVHVTELGDFESVSITVKFSL